MDPLTASYLPWILGGTLLVVAALGVLDRCVVQPIERRHRAQVTAGRPPLDWAEIAPMFGPDADEHVRRAYLLVAHHLQIEAARLRPEDPVCSFVGPIERQLSSRTSVDILVEQLEEYLPDADPRFASVRDLVLLLARSPSFRRGSGEEERRLRLRWT